MVSLALVVAGDLLRGRGVTLTYCYFNPYVRCWEGEGLYSQLRLQVSTLAFLIFAHFKPVISMTVVFVCIIVFLRLYSHCMGTWIASGFTG